MDKSRGRIKIKKNQHMKTANATKMTKYKNSIRAKRMETSRAKNLDQSGTFLTMKAKQIFIKSR